MKAFYDEKPAKYEKSGDGYIYRWDIEQYTDENEEETTTAWKCKEVRVSGTVTKDRLTQAVITSSCDPNRESKYMNDYNSAKNGMFDDDPTYKQLCIDRYINFLQQRQTLKMMINSDCAELKIY